MHFQYDYLRNNYNVDRSAEISASSEFILSKKKMQRGRFYPNKT